MKNSLTIHIAAVALLTTLAIPVPLAAQNKHSQQNPHHYQLIDLGSTFGGPQSYFVPGSGYAFSGSSVLNNEGTVVGFADTSIPDPFPDFCFDGFDANSQDCLVSHAFRAGSEGGLIHLGILPGGGSGAPMWISGNGLIAGFSENGKTDPLYAGLPQLRAVLWHDSKIIDLGTLPEGGFESIANSVNGSGQVVGTALNATPDANSMQVGVFLLYGGDGGIAPPYQYQTRAFLWDEEEGMQDLGTLPGGTDAQAILINERGQVVGYSYTASTQSGACYPLATSSFVWKKETGMIDLGGFGGTCTVAAALNNQGQIVGESFRTGDEGGPAFLWENGTLHKLGGSLGGDFAGASAINEAGETAGFGYLPGNSTFHATLWQNLNEMTDLGVVGGDPCSYAAAINERMQIVGASIANCDDEFRAFLWQDGSLFDLNSLIPPASNLYLQITYAINDAGEIAGTGVDPKGNEHAFLLVPCDDNHPGVKGCDYSLVDESATAAVGSIPRPMPSVRPTLRLPLPLRRTISGGQSHTPKPAVPPSSPVGNVQSSGTAVGGDQQAEFLFDSPISTRIHGLKGYCVVNRETDELTGGCLWTNAWVCLSGHSFACPTGVKALKPEEGGCGLTGGDIIDFARGCTF